MKLIFHSTCSFYYILFVLFWYSLQQPFLHCHFIYVYVLHLFVSQFNGNHCASNPHNSMILCIDSLQKLFWFNLKSIEQSTDRHKQSTVIPFLQIIFFYHHFTWHYFEEMIKENRHCGKFKLFEMLKSDSIYNSI